MKTNKPKADKTKGKKKTAKKAVKKQIEQSLTEKFLEAVKGLGHNAELIADDIAKASKVAARKLSKKFKEVKEAVVHKIEDLKTPDEAVAAPAKAVKTAGKAVKKATKTVKKVAGKAVPAVSSVKVDSMASEQKVASAMTKAPVKQAPAPKNAAQPKVMEKKTATNSAQDTKKAVVKAVSNNPVKKVAAKAIPPKKNTTAKK